MNAEQCAMFDTLDTLADEAAGDVQVLQWVWAARLEGDPVRAQAAADMAAQSLGRLF